METLQQYLQMTKTLRKDSSHLFVAIVKPHKPIAPCTIAHWLKEVLKLSDIDISTFTAHSTRGASTSGQPQLQASTSTHTTSTTASGLQLCV